MVVSDLIALLANCRPDSEVYLNWEGELVPAREARALDVHTYSAGGSVSEDYYPEVRSCDLDEGGRKWRAVLID